VRTEPAAGRGSLLPRMRGGSGVAGKTNYRPRVQGHLIPASRAGESAVSAEERASHVCVGDCAGSVHRIEGRQWGGRGVAVLHGVCAWGAHR
jgi:hypothetical protein